MTEAREILTQYGAMQHLLGKLVGSVEALVESAHERDGDVKDIRDTMERLDRRLSARLDVSDLQRERMQDAIASLGKALESMKTPVQEFSAWHANATRLTSVIAIIGIAIWSVLAPLLPDALKWFFRLLGK